MTRAPLVLSLALATACGVSIELEGAGVRGSGVSATELRSVRSFDRVEIGGNLDADIAVAPGASVELAGDDNLLPIVETEVRGRTLHVKPTETIRPRAGVTVTIRTPSLEGVSIGGSGDVRVRGVRSRAFDADVGGSASMIAEGAFGELDARVSGSGDLRLGGTAETIDARVSGSGEIDARDVPARSARVRVSGSGEVAVQAAESLDAEVSGSGDVRYVGNPSVRSHVSGSGSVRPASR